MFESRFRAYENEHPHRDGNSQRNRFVTTSAVYRNHIYSSVFASNKKEGASQAKKRHDEHIASVRAKRSKLEQSIAQRAWHKEVDFASTFLAEQDMRRELQELDRSIAHLESQDAEKLWYDRIQELQPEQVGSLAVLSYANGNTEEIFNINPDRCTCGRILHFNCVTHMEVCLTCKKCKKVLLAAEDLQELMHKMPSGPPPPPPPPMPPNAVPEDAARTVTDQSSTTLASPTTSAARSNSGSATSSASGPKAMKPPTHTSYKRYLMQFANTACEIPKRVWSALYESLASIHLLSDLRCKPVPVEKILKDHDLQPFIAHSTRIMKLFNQEPIPVLTVDLIDRLVQRYDELYQTALRMFEEKTYTKATLPGKEILTHIFLRMEQRPDLARAFTTHKTNNASNSQTHAFWHLLVECSKRSSLSWKY